MTAYDRTERVSAPRSGVRSGPRTGGVPIGGARDGWDAGRIGRYRLVEEIGEGGMGVVHLALDPRGRAVAIKVLRAHVAHDADARQRLMREVETLSRIRDPRVASVIDADVMGPRPYIVTRYVPGPALDEIVEEHGPLHPGELVSLARGVAEAIRSIHACGVVHRDIKPGNVLVEEGEPVLIDFGIAHVQDDVRHTVGGLVMGTPGYLSPELVEGAPITDATDWWGWAATITYAASGRPPFGRSRMDAVLSRVRAGDVDVDGVDPRLVPLLRASLSPDPSRRPHADEVIAALEQYAAGRAATVPTPHASPWGASTEVLGAAPAAPALPSATQVFQDRGTAVLPPVAPTADDVRWAPPPTGPRRRPEPEPEYEPEHWDEGQGGTDLYDERYGRSAGRDEWDDEWGEEQPEQAPREGDPRIGMAMRTGVLGAAGIAWVGALMAWPGYVLVALAAWSVLARATDRSVSALVFRRYAHGRRGSDIPLAVITSPWHLLVGAIATAVTLVLPIAVALAGIFATALLLAGATGTELVPGSPTTLAVGGIAGLAMLWWGPGGVSLRRGSRSIVRRTVPLGTASQVVAIVLVVAGLVLGLVAVDHGESLSWLPFGSNPLAR
ncbi:serine/threonine-protein kinase [Intrasporangium flavum]|uniref:serine/threonine-protein kinase n=1 Tax=Intrasporangium flavum TaxID=1428657 RepID=UPI00096C3805|nr:serine/threonine-protein kinase [Intrasporangium flavum]